MGEEVANMFRQFIRVSVVAVLVAVSGCGSDDDGTTATSSASGLSATAIEHAEEIQAVVLQYEDGWAQGDAESIATVLDDDRFVFNEPGSTNLDKDEFMSLMDPFIGNTSVDSTDLRYFVGDDEVIQVQQAWGFGGGTSETNPVVEVDVFTVGDGAIISIRSMYGAEFVAEHAGIEGAEEAVAAYESAWSSGDVSQVAGLYADDAVRSQPLYGIDAQGADEIARAASEHFVRHPDTVMRVVEPYVFSSADTLAPTYGAVFVLENGSACEVLVLLEPDASGAITNERVYFDAETLGSCDE
jgi:ketosteroid isomerase-like protein